MEGHQVFSSNHLILKNEMVKAQKVFSWCERLFSIFGVNPMKSNNYIFTAVMFYMAVHLIVTSIDAVECLEHDEPLADVLWMLGAITMTLLKLSFYKFYGRDLANLLRKIYSDYTVGKYQSESEVQVLFSYMSRARTYFKIVVPLYFSASVFFVVKNFFIDSKRENDEDCLDPSKFFLPYRMTFEYLSNYKEYLWIYISALPMTIICSFGVLVDSVLIVTICTHICGQLAILSQCKLTNLAKDALIFKWKLRGIVNYYNRQIRISNRIESIFSVFFLHEMLNSLFFFCIIGYNLVMNWSQSELKILIVFILDSAALVVIMLTYCHLGQCFIDESQKICRALYNDMWYKLEAKHMKCYVMFIERAQKPLVLTACKFCIYNFELSVSLMKTGLAYLSVLRAINEL